MVCKGILMWLHISNITRKWTRCTSTHKTFWFCWPKTVITSQSHVIALHLQSASVTCWRGMFPPHAGSHTVKVRECSRMGGSSLDWLTWTFVLITKSHALVCTAFPGRQGRKEKREQGAGNWFYIWNYIILRAL